MLDIQNIPSPGALYGHPFVSPVRDPDHVKLDVSTLTAVEVDAYGYIKPGVILQQNGAIITAANQTAYGVVIEAEKLPGRSNNTGLAADTTDPLIAVCTDGLINRDIVKDNLGRDLNPNELAALAAGGFKVTTT